MFFLLYHSMALMRDEEEGTNHPITMMDGTFTPFLDGMSSCPLLDSIPITHFDGAATMSCIDAI